MSGFLLDSVELPKGDWTVIGIYDTGQIIAEHVRASSAMAAFTELARRDSDLSMVMALPGLLHEGNELTFPGESLVDASTILEQPEVFGDEP